MAKHSSSPEALATAKLHREWLRALPDLTGKSLSKIADETGIARTTLTKRLKPSDAGTSTLNATTIDRIIERYRIPGPSLATDVGGNRASRAGFSEDAIPYRYGAGAEIDEAVRALSGGKPGIDPWTMKSRAIELEGYLPGDVVLVDLNADPQHGDVVCAQVTDFARGRTETVMRVFEAAGPVKLLVAKTMDPGLQRSLVIDGEKVRVKGVILRHRLRATARAAA
jgi:hypothetical protein